jgi:hypothetical protein
VNRIEIIRAELPGGALAAHRALEEIEGVLTSRLADPLVVASWAEALEYYEADAYAKELRALASALKLLRGSR